MDIRAYIIEKGKQAKTAARYLGNIETNIKNKALNKMADDMWQKA